MINQPIGIKIPIQMGKTGFFEQTFTTLDEAKSNLLNLLLTRKGERLMFPDFGTNIFGFLFNPMNNISGQIESEIRKVIDFWLPYINVDEIIVNTSTENQIEINIKFGLKQDLSKFEELIIVFQ